MSGRCQESAWKVSGRCQKVLECVRKMSVSCTEGSGENHNYRLGQVRKGVARAGQVNSEQVHSREVKLGQVKLCQVKSG